MLKITGGEFLNRQISILERDNLRPSSSRLRQALFNSIQAEVPNARVLDLFAGSGILGIEALSRGALVSVFLEMDRRTLTQLAKNLDLLNCKDRSKLITAELVSGKGRPLFKDTLKKQIESYGPYDLVLVDPPYAGGWEMPVLQGFSEGELLSEVGILVLEWGSVKSQVQELPDQVGVLEKIREKKYGDSVLTTYQRRVGM